MKSSASDMVGVTQSVAFRPAGSLSQYQMEGWTAAAANSADSHSDVSLKKTNFYPT